MSATLEQINRLAAELLECYLELSELIRRGSWEKEARPLVMRIRQIEGELAQLWEWRRCEKSLPARVVLVGCFWANDGEEKSTDKVACR
jgi:hypothetical protein